METLAELLLVALAENVCVGVMLAEREDESVTVWLALSDDESVGDTVTVGETVAE